MIAPIDEIVLTFDPALLERWKSGDPERMPQFLGRRSTASNQPSYHFGEAFVLDHFHRTEGWEGSTDYMLLPEIEPTIQRHEDGRRLLERVADPDRLAALRAERRRDIPHGPKGNGEPDVFLCKPSGELMFLEVKKGGDRIRQNQIDCLAQIRHHLGCKVGVVYLQELGKRPRAAKTYGPVWRPQ